MWPLISFQRCSVLTGSAAEPDTIRRKLEQAALRSAAALRRSRIPGGDELCVDRRHRHEESEFAAGDTVPHGIRVEARQHVAGCARPQRTANYVDDSVHVVQRQTQQNAIVRRPLPGIHQALDLRSNVGMGRDDALGPAGGAAGVENHGAPRIGSNGQVRWLGKSKLVIRQRAQGARRGNWLHKWGSLKIKYHGRCSSIVDKVFQLRPGSS